MLTPSIFGENLFDDWFDDFPFFDDRDLRKVDKKLYGRRAGNLMKTDIQEMKDGYKMEVDLPGFKKDEVNVELNNGYLTIEAAKSLVSRCDPRIGLIRSWDFGEWNYPVIIDNMMNLEMLFWASKHTGDPVYRDVAVRHADITMKNHFRDDASSFHVVSYNDDGTVESRGTFQGYSDSSAWARGQAWGLYGYTMCYRETGDAKYLKHAERIADFIMHHPNTPADRIPYWDYNAPDIPDAPRDASAAAVVSSALFELSTLVPEAEGKRYFDYAETLLMNLSSDAYLARKGANGGFILMHSVGHLPADSEIDTPLNYADYYYLEAIGRYLSLRGLDPRRI